MFGTRAISAHTISAQLDQSIAQSGIASKSSENFWEVPGTISLVCSTFLPFPQVLLEHEHLGDFSQEESFRAEFGEGGCVEAEISKEKHLFSEWGQGIQWMKALVRNSTGKAIQWRGLGHSVNRQTLWIEIFCAQPPSQISAPYLCRDILEMLRDKFLHGGFAPPEPELRAEFWETNFGRPNFGPESLGWIWGFFFFSKGGPLKIHPRETHLSKFTFKIQPRNRAKNSHFTSAGSFGCEMLELLEIHQSM